MYDVTTCLSYYSSWKCPWKVPENHLCKACVVKPEREKEKQKKACMWSPTPSTMLKFYMSLLCSQACVNMSVSPVTVATASAFIIGGKPEVMSAKWDLAEIFLLTFPGFTVWAVTVTVPPGNQRTEGRAGAAEYIEIVQFSETSLCRTLSPWPGEAFHGRVFCCDGCERAFWDLLSPWMDQDAALPAASSVHVGGASPSWLRPVQRAAGCSAHPGRHHHRSLVLRPSPASCRQGSSVFLCLQQYLYVIVSFSVSLWAF